MKDYVFISGGVGDISTVSRAVQRETIWSTTYLPSTVMITEITIQSLHDIAYWILM